MPNPPPEGSGEKQPSTAGASSMLDGTRSGKSERCAGRQRASGRVKVANLIENCAARGALELIIEESPDFQCVGSYRSAQDALSKAESDAPDLMIVSVRLRGVSGVECMQQLRSRLPRLTFVAVSEVLDAQTVAEGTAAGGIAFLALPFSSAQCLTAMRFSVGGREKWAPESSKATGRYEGLTRRETEVMARLANGLLYKEIAHELGISFSAVHKHQHNIFAKLRASNRTEAISRWHHVS